MLRLVLTLHLFFRCEVLLSLSRGLSRKFPYGLNGVGHPYLRNARTPIQIVVWFRPAFCLGLRPMFPWALELCFENLIGALEQESVKIAGRSDIGSQRTERLCPAFFIV